MQLPDMNLLVALDALLDEGSVVGAARRMNLSPAAMSRTLTRIREAVGDPVSDVKALNATKPAFGEAAVGAAKQWRFKPWTVSAERPAVVEARNDMLFSPEPISREGVQLNFTEVKFQSCRDLSEEVSQFRREHPTRPLSAMKSFAITRVAVMLPAFSGKTTYADGLVLADQPQDPQRRIGQRCKSAQCHQARLWRSGCRCGQAMALQAVDSERRAACGGRGAQRYAVFARAHQP